MYLYKLFIQQLEQDNKVRGFVEHLINFPTSFMWAGKPDSIYHVTLEILWTSFVLAWKRQCFVKLYARCIVKRCAIKGVTHLTILTKHILH